MNVKDFTAVLEKLVRTQMPYGYDLTENLLIGINIDGVIHDIKDIRVVRGGIIIEPLEKEIKQQTPKLLQPQKKNKKEEVVEKTEE